VVAGEPLLTKQTLHRLLHEDREAICWPLNPADDKTGPISPRHATALVYNMCQVEQMESSRAEDDPHHTIGKRPWLIAVGVQQQRHGTGRKQASVEGREHTVREIETQVSERRSGQPGAEHASAGPHFENKIPSPGFCQPQHSLCNRLAVRLGQTSTLVESGGLSVESGRMVVHLVTKDDGVDPSL
jgi:hypothetical protein